MPFSTLEKRQINVAPAGQVYTPGYNLIGSYTWNDVEVTQSETDNKGYTPLRVPEHRASLWAD